MIGSSFKVLFSDKPRTYSGPELRPHFLLTEMGLQGSGIAAFLGPCQVKTEHLVDWEDRLVSDHIQSKQMLHLLGEFFGMTLREGVFAQRLIVAKLFEDLVARLPRLGGGWSIRRSGDDIFVGKGSEAERKLTVSIVTASPVSVLFHLGINVDPAGAPVPAIGLNELGIDAKEWIGPFLNSIQEEILGIDWACVKVRPVV